ncbi:hypothetical protein ACHAWU_002827 [Discostella pseudostelligera]|jgi:ABC-type transporter Mla subunit MlaD|uniref:Uncharacterized protein n=1 Tax=Discostella pseudostelligera TaxID=259834 RepID=A0ABD3M2R7_9STRA
MSTLEQKLRQLEEATTIAQSVLSEKESKLALASEALEKSKSKLKSLDAEVQQTLQVNDTDLPELIDAKMIAQQEYDEALRRYEVNQQYLALFRKKCDEATGV